MSVSGVSAAIALLLQAGQKRKSDISSWYLNYVYSDHDGIVMPLVIKAMGLNRYLAVLGLAELLTPQERLWLPAKSSDLWPGMWLLPKNDSKTS